MRESSPEKKIGATGLYALSFLFFEEKNKKGCRFHPSFKKTGNSKFY